MRILNNPIDTFSFSEIAQFCSEGQIEGVQLDYKRELPAKGLAKFFAAFSNTRGGLLIIGVEEDSRTGKPVTWDGLVYDSKLVDRIHQYASNVDPRPLYEVHVTDEQYGKVFILVRVFEGDRTPYYVQNDANLYIRTGNITDPIGLASPDAAELLFGKRTKADLARKNYIIRADNIFKAATKQADIEREQAITIERQAWKQKQKQGSTEAYNPSYSTNPLGTNSSICTILLQPFFPTGALATPQDILTKVDQLRICDPHQVCFPDRNLKPMQDGIYNFEWKREGSIHCQQIYSTGLLFDADDVFKANENGMSVRLSILAKRFYMLMLSASRFYNLFGYQGGLKGFIRLENIEGVLIYPIIPYGQYLDPIYFEDKKGSLLSKYEWVFELDTAILHDPKSRQLFYIGKIKEIYWSLGDGTCDEDIIEKFLDDHRWLVK